MLSLPDQGTDGKPIEAHFLLKLPPESGFHCFPGVDAAARCNPKPMAALRRADTKQENLMLWGQEYGSNCVAIDHGRGPLAFPDG